MSKFLPLGVILALLALAPALAEVAVAPAPTTNASATIATGNTFQVVLTANSAANGTSTVIRHSLTMQNNNTGTDNCWVYVGAGSATKANSILLAPGYSYQRYYPFIPSDVIQATCATTGDTIYVDTQ